jgi:hypothetical protein
MNFFEKYQYLLDTWKINLLLPYTYQKISLILNTKLGTSMKMFEKYMVPIPIKYTEKNMVVGICLPKINLGLNIRPKTSMIFF